LGEYEKNQKKKEYSTLLELDQAKQKSEEKIGLSNSFTEIDILSNNVSRSKTSMNVSSNVQLPVLGLGIKGSSSNKLYSGKKLTVL
jgi:sugar diacid utilization regulator